MCKGPRPGWFFCSPYGGLWGGAHPGLSVPRLTGSEPLTILPLTLEPEAAAHAHYKACDRLKLERKQRRMCRRDPGVAETLVEAVSMSALECQYQFRFERWNCTLEGRYRASLLKRGECARRAEGAAPWAWSPSAGSVGGAGCPPARPPLTHGRTVAGGAGHSGSVGRVRGSADGCGRLLWARGQRLGARGRGLAGPLPQYQASAPGSPSAGRCCLGL